MVDKIDKYFRQSKYHKEMREVAIDLGNCVTCFKEKEDPRYKQCFECRKYAREWYHNNKKEKC
jgi:hypothetical protein